MAGGIEIEVQSPYGTKLGAGPIITGRNWKSSPRLNKIGVFSFEMPLSDPRRSLLVQKRYLCCYGMVNRARTELGKPGIIDSVVKVLDAQGIPTGMLKVKGRDLFAELADLNIHELTLLGTTTRSPDRMEYWDGTEEAFIPHGSGAHMEYAYDENGGTGTVVPADDEDDVYVGDDDVFDIVNYPNIGDAYNTDSTPQRVRYWNGSAWATGTILSDTTRLDGATWGQNGSIRWDRQGDWAKCEINGQNKYWLRFNFGEDLSGDVTLYEVTVTQEIPTATALADWLGYTDAASETPISALGWTFEATHPATENTVFLKLRDISAFEALILIGEQTGENFRLGTGRSIEWMQDDKIASGVIATNVASGVAAQDNAAICIITKLKETKDSYEVGSRVYPKGGGGGSLRITLEQCTDSPPAGYTLSKTANYLRKDSVEEATPTGYGRRIEMTKFWPNMVSPNWASARDANCSNALLQLCYEYLSRHWEPQTSYIFSVVKLVSEVKVGQSIQLHYWVVVNGVAVWDLGVTAPLHLWMLEITHAIDAVGARVIAMQIATVDAWPSSDARIVSDIISHLKALLAADGPSNAMALTPDSLADLLDGVDMSEYYDPPEPGVGLYDAYVCVRDVKEQNIDGGGFTSGAWQTRDINDEQADALSICSISSNQITLAAGTYRCHIACPVYNVNRHQARLRNVTGSTTLLLGTSQYSWSGAMTGIRCFIVGRFTVAASQALEIQHRCETTCDYDGFGSHSGYGDEVYTIAEFWREA